MKLFTEIGSPITLPITTGFHNLTLAQQQELEENGWGSPDFEDPAFEPFWEFNGSTYCITEDCRAVDRFNILYGSRFKHCLGYGILYGVEFLRDDLDQLQHVSLQQVEPLNKVF